MCLLVFCKIALFPALLQREKMFCKAAASHADFYLILFKTTFLLACNQHHLSVQNVFLFVRYQTTLLTLYITERMFWFVGN